MGNSRIEILLVEDNADDAELTLRTLRKNHVANRVLVLTDGQARGSDESRERLTRTPTGAVPVFRPRGSIA